jgi:5-methyltetrahydropteroyltriglutamate--homocysteine methyltransferase
LATRRDAGSELDFAVDLINRVVDGVDGIRIGVHVCRGNWSKKDEVHLSGDYEPLVPALKKLNVQQFVLEYATPRAGEFAIVGEALNHREIGLGVVNPRSDEIESVDTIVARAEKALKYYKPEDIFLHPDCGFGTFSRRCVADEQTAVAKMTRIAEAAKALRDRHG